MLVYDGLEEAEIFENFYQEYISQNNDVINFLNNQNYCSLSVDSLRAFAERYNNLQRRGGAKFSERVFIYWTVKKLLQNNVSLNVKIHDKFNIPILPVEENIEVPKIIDFSFQCNNSSRVYIEFKCNIDMVEKDLYKFYLMKRNNHNPSIITSIFIWERVDHWKYANGNHGQYALLLNDAKVKGSLDEFFYFPVYDRNNKYINDEIIEHKINIFSNFLCEHLIQV